MKLAYIVNITLPPNDWAHSLQILEMSKVFSDYVDDINLIIPKRKLDIDYSVLKTSGRSINLIQLPCIDIFSGNTSVIFFKLRLFSFYISAFFYFLFKKDFDLIYSRDDYSAFFLSNVVLEKHSFPKKPNFFQKIAFKRARKIIVLTSFLKEKFVYVGVPRENIFVSPDAVDLALFLEDKFVNREEFGFKSEDFIIGYVGALKTMGMDKGLNILFETLKELPENCKVLIVGGWGDDLVYYKDLVKKLSLESRVFFTGKVPHNEVAKYMKACDVLVAPFPENEHFSFYMSPLKIFEYMASQRPIITTDLPSIREVLTNGENAILARPGDTESLKKAVELIYNNKDLREKLASNAFKLVKEKYTWQKRAEDILKFIKT